MKRTVVTITVLLIAVIMLFSFVACEKRNKEPERTGGGGNVTLYNYWNCECDIGDGIYDLNNVALDFTFGCRDEKAIDKFYNAYYYANGYLDEYGRLKPEYESVGRPQVPIYLFFNSFGNRYFIKVVNNFFTSEFFNGNHTEKIIVPAELFYNEYGLIEFFFTDDTEGGIGSFPNRNKTFCTFYYHKSNDKVYISDADLAPADVSPGDEENTTVKFMLPDPATQDYCGYTAQCYRSIADTSDFPVRFYFGRVYGADIKNIPSVDIYFVTQNASGEEQKTFVKTIDDYMSDEYLCTKVFDYYGKIKRIVYNHSETVNIPHELFAGDSGTIELCVYEAGTQNKVTGIGILYKRHPHIEGEMTID